VQTDFERVKRDSDFVSVNPAVAGLLIHLCKICVNLAHNWTRALVLCHGWDVP